MPLQPVVELYRAASRPPIVDGEFSARLEFSKAVPLILAAKASGKGRFISISVDGKAQDIDQLALPTSGLLLDFTFKQVTNTNSTFHKNLAALLKSGAQISRGECPTDYYLIEENFYDGDSGAPPAKIGALAAVCTLIKGLQALALYHDENSTPRLVFVAPSESSVSHVVIEPKITGDLLERIQLALDTRIIDDLTSAGTGDPHKSTKVGVFGVTITEVLSNISEPGRFNHLVTHWSEFLDRYHKNLSTYLSGFAFHKVKKEVAKAEFDIAEQYSKLMGDLAGKLFGIPISFAVVVTMPKATTALEAILIVISLLLVAVVMVGTVSNQQDQLERISHAKKVVLGAFEGRKDLYPDDLQTAISEMTTELANNENKLKQSLRTFRVLGWAPVIVSVFLIVAFWFEPKPYVDFANSLIAKSAALISKMADKPVAPVTAAPLPISHPTQRATEVPTTPCNRTATPATVNSPKELNCQTASVATPAPPLSSHSPH